jgi:membrane-associated phospholipid phosphatase
MLVVAYRYHRPSFWVLVPVIGTFYPATVYGRYHYVLDTVAGIALGLAVGWAAPRIEAWWDALRGRPAIPLGTKPVGGSQMG